MKEKGIKNLIIDFGGVLIDLDRQRCIENFAKLGMSNVEAMLDVCHQQGFFLQHEKGLMLPGIVFWEVFLPISWICC